MNSPKLPRTLRFLALFAVCVGAFSAYAACAIPASQHPVVASRLGTPSSTGALEAVIDEPGPISIETVVGADWQVDRSGLINLKHPKARAAGLVDGPEPIQIYFHALTHPKYGLFLVDTGAEDALANDRSHAALRGIVANAAHIDLLKVRHSTGAWLRARGQTPNGVFLTHLHLDHVAGMPDIAGSVPVFAGPGETTETGAFNILTRPIIDRALAGHAAIRTWQFQRDPSGVFAGVLDVFGDGSLWALHVPGHTPGSVAFLVRTPQGPVLLTGDACHTAWGWEHGVEPGTFSDDPAESAVSLAKLRDLVARHPSIEVRLGHQALPPSETSEPVAQRKD